MPCSELKRSQLTAETLRQRHTNLRSPETGGWGSGHDAHSPSGLVIVIRFIISVTGGCDGHGVGICLDDGMQLVVDFGNSRQIGLVADVPGG